MNTEPANKCGLKREDFQTTVNGKKTDLFVLRNKQGNEVAVTNYGGAVVAIMMPDKDGNYANLIQGHENMFFQIKIKFLQNFLCRVLSHPRNYH